MSDSVAPPRSGPAARLVTRMRGADSAHAVVLAGAMIATNVVALALTIVFGRILGTGGYGEVAALISTFLILSVIGQALQLATARAGTLGELGRDRELHATLERWTLRLAQAGLAACVFGVALRVPLARAIGVHAEWGAAAVLPTAVAWVLLCIQRGALQAEGAYREVGASLVLEQAARLAIGAALALAGLGATGAFLGSPLAMIVMAVVLDRRLSARLGAADGDPRRSLARHVRAALPAILGLAVIAALQNVDVIVAKHRLPDDPAGAYAAAAVAAKVLIWVSLGVAMWVVPEAARRAAQGLDPLGVLSRGLGVLAVAAVPALALFAIAPDLLLRLGFGAKFAPGGDALLLLGTGMTILSGVALATQFQLALHRLRFLVPLTLVALAEPLLLLIPAADRVALARFVLLVQLIAAAVVTTAVLAGQRQARRARPAR